MVAGLPWRLDAGEHFLRRVEKLPVKLRQDLILALLDPPPAGEAIPKCHVGRHDRAGERDGPRQY
jgi:hypothetical protein